MKYTIEKNTQILVSLLKQNNIRKIIVSPGTTNINFVYTVQNDGFFEVYSAFDERSAAYMACGMSVECNEPVVLSCTGATASRNYIPGLTEAYYRKIKIIAVTSTQYIGRIDNNIPQVIDRSTQLNDIVKKSIQLRTINNDEDEWACNVLLNKALLEMNRHGGGPIHINLETTYSDKYEYGILPPTRSISYVSENTKEWPEIKANKVGVFIGQHKPFTKEEIKYIEKFCEVNNGVVLCEHGSNYWGKYKVLPLIITSQDLHFANCRFLDLIVELGEVPGPYISVDANKIWRVNIDGEVKDAYKKLSCVFEMEEIAFFKHYSIGKKSSNPNYCLWKKEFDSLQKKIFDLPFSNAWIAKTSAKIIPKNSVLHLGILNSLRIWNYFELTENTLSYSNTGGFGIDGCVSSLMGAALANKNKLFFGVVGDLAFFYDMNSLGNRHIPNNVRLMVINNGCGTEFKNYNHKAAKLKDEANEFVAAFGHNGNKSRDLVRHYSIDLGFKYLCASNKSDYMNVVKDFFESKEYDYPIIFEVFTNYEDESDALKILNSLVKDNNNTSGLITRSRRKIKKIMKNINIK